MTASNNSKTFNVEKGEGGRGRAEVMMTSQGSESTSFFHVIIGEAPLLKKKKGTK